MILTSVEACESNNFNGQFAFINKHARNFDKREKKEVTSIASHAAGFYYHKLKKDGAARRSPSSSTSRDTSPDNDRQLCKSKKLHQTQPGEPTILLWDTGIAPDLPKKAAKRSTIRSRRQARDISCENTTALAKTLCPSSHDPFETLPYQMGPKTTELTQIWYRYFMNLCSPAGASKKLQMVANQAWHKHVSGILEDHMQACAFFAGALAIKARFLAPETAKETWPEVYRLHTEALAGLRERLHSESYSEGVLLTMFTVGSVNFYSGDWADNRKHKSAANHVTQRLGGFDALSDTLKDYMIEGCLNTSYCLMTRPRFYHRRWVTEPWTSQPLSYKRPVFVDDESSPFQRSETSLSGGDTFAAARLNSYFRSYREVVGVCRAAQSLGADDVQDKDDMFTWLQGRRRTMRVQCLDYWCDLRDSIGNNSRADRFARSEADEQILQDRLHQALVLGAFCFDSMQIHHKRCHATALPMWLIYLPIPQLRKALHTVLETMTSRGTLSHPEALLWLFYVGACAEEIARTMGVAFWPDDLELICHDWFVDVADRLGLSGLDQIKQILRDFVYEDCFGDEYLEVLLQKRWML